MYSLGSRWGFISWRQLFCCALGLLLTNGASIAENRTSFESKISCNKLRKIFLEPKKESYQRRGDRSLPDREKLDNLRLHLRVPGQQRTRFEVSYFRNRKWDSVVVTPSEVKRIDLKMRMFQGHTKSFSNKSRKRKKDLASATVLKLDDGRYRLEIIHNTKRRKLETIAEFEGDCEGKVTATTVKRPVRSLGIDACGTYAPESSSSHSDHSSSRRSSAFPVAHSVTLKRATVAVTADGAYTNSFGEEGALTRIASIMNGVDNIYQEDLGVTLSISRETVYSAADDPFLSLGIGQNADPEDLLEAFADLGKEADHNHLFTDRNLSGSIIGVAYLNGLCSSSASFGLSQDINGASSRIELVAHEIGHNFGADHTSSHSPCGSVSIMNAGLGSPSGCFANTSRSEIATAISGFSCLSDVILDDSPSPSASPTPSVSPSPGSDPSSTPSPSPSASEDDNGGGGGGGGGATPSPSPSPSPFFVPGDDAELRISRRGRKRKVRLSCSLSEAGIPVSNARISFQRKPFRPKSAEFSTEDTRVANESGITLLTTRKSGVWRCAAETLNGEITSSETRFRSKKRRRRK